jgi:hypothetical protein
VAKYRFEKESIFAPSVFSDVIEFKAQKIEIDKVKIARLFIKRNFSRRFEDARKLLEKVSELDFKADYFLTPSGFILIPWKFSKFEEAAEEGKL